MRERGWRKTSGENIQRKVLEGASDTREWAPDASNMASSERRNVEQKLRGMAHAMGRGFQ